MRTLALCFALGFFAPSAFASEVREIELSSCYLLPHFDPNIHQTQNVSSTRVSSSIQFGYQIRKTILVLVINDYQETVYEKEIQKLVNEQFQTESVIEEDQIYSHHLEIVRRNAQRQFQEWFGVSSGWTCL